MPMIQKNWTLNVKQLQEHQFIALCSPFEAYTRVTCDQKQKGLNKPKTFTFDKYKVYILINKAL